MDQLLELERMFWTGGVEFYDENLTSDFLMLFPGLGMLDRAATIEGLRGAQRWVSVEMEDAHFSALADGAVLLSYRARASREGQEKAYTALVSSAYVQQDGGWRLASHHQSPIAG